MNLPEGLIWYTYIERKGGGIELSYNAIIYKQHYSLVLKASNVFEQYANNIFIAVYIYFMSRLLSDIFLVFVLFCYWNC
jgi:hypothetical protein